MATHVVHLEDDGPLRDVLKFAFQAAEPRVNLKQFVNSDEVVKYVEENSANIDLFILDIRVPGSLDGLGVAKKIRELLCDKPIVITSAYRQPNREMLKSLNCEWVAKPWHIMETTHRLLQLASKPLA